MQKILKILHLEDDLNDAELVGSMLRAGGIRCEINLVRRREDFISALAAGGFDLIFSDYSIPSFGGREALLLAREKRPEIPFLYISGTIGEERAVEALQNGATDYILKSNIKRLVPAVSRVLAELDQRRARREAEDALAKAEEQLRQSQKLEAIGRLAGGVAHDFNNILTAIMSYASFLKRSIDPGAPGMADLEEIIKAAERAAALTRQLLAFSRKQVLEPKVLGLNTVINDMGKMLQRLIGENISLETGLAPDLLEVRVDPGQMQQVAMNLAVNARDAMPDGGVLVIETANAEVDAAYSRRYPQVKPGRYVLLTVRDTGEGMDAKTLENIFEPFFTTKEPGKGTGLGLSMVYGIVKQSGGSIVVESAPGRGSVFRIYLPPAVPLEAEQTALAAAASPSAGAEMVLLVEDEESIRRMAGRALAQAGYEVMVAREAGEALSQAGNDGGVDLLVTDLVLPGKDGVELARELASKYGVNRVLFMSGYSPRPFGDLEAAGLRFAFIEKPFFPDALLRKVRELLDAPPPRA